MDKPIKPNVDLPDSFGGVKNNFSSSKILNGYEKDVPDIFGGANINYMLDTLGKRQTYYDTIVDFINGLPIGKTLTTDNNNKLTYADLRTDFSGLANVDLSNLTATGENHFANKDLSNLTATGEKHFINKQQLTNCILEAPNGVITASGSNTITIHSGLKVLIPNGRDADNQLINIEYTLPSDISYSRTASGRLHGVAFVNNNLELKLAPITSTYSTKSYASMLANTGYMKDKIVYVENDNIWYETSDYGVTWTPTLCCPVARVEFNADNTSVGGEGANPISLMTNNVESSLYMCQLSLPSRYFNCVYPLAWNNATSWDISAPCDGYFAIWRDQSSVHDFVVFQQLFDDGSFGLEAISTSNPGNSSSLHLFMPAQKGQIVRVSHNGSGTVRLWCFVPAKGNE